MKTFNKYLVEEQVTETDMELIKEGLQEEWSPELEARVTAAIDAFLEKYSDNNGNLDINALDILNEEITNEGLLGSIFGGLTGFALGKSLGMMIAKVLGIQKGIFYDLITSRLVGAALGASLGKRI